MSKTSLLFGFLIAVAAPGWPQEQSPPSIVVQPLNNQPVPPAPDKDGIYSVGHGVVSPIFVQRTEAAYPADVSDQLIEGATVLSLVIGADGVPADIKVVSSHGDAFDDATIEAVKKSTFAPGSVNDKPVPVRAYIRVRFSPDKRPAFPRIFSRLGTDSLGQSVGAGNTRQRKFDKPPVALHVQPAEYSQEARIKKLSGVVVLTTVVTTDGLPSDIKVVKPLGMGLDENAIEALSRYRFKPATKDGEPVAAQITIEVSFRTY